MDPFSAVSLVVQAVDISIQAANVIRESYILAASAGRRYRRTRFGRIGELFYFLGLIDTNALQEFHRNINLWTDAETLAWRNSYKATCNAISVAGAIFASIGMAALQLPDMYNVHWTARSLCMTSMLLGILAVTTATSQQQSIATLNNPTAVRLWLSRGRPTGYLSDMRIRPNRVLKKLRQWMDARSPDETQGHQGDKYQSIEGFKGLPLESSISALKATAMPSHLLSLAVLVFVIGFGLYLLFLWVEDIGNQPIASRNVFVVFIVSVSVFTIYEIFISSNIISNGEKKAKEFELFELGEAHKPVALAQLEKDLHNVQRRIKTLAEQREFIESQILGVTKTMSHTTKEEDGFESPETGV